MRTVLILILTFGAVSFTVQKDEERMKAEDFKKMLCANWSYEYSIVNGDKEIISNETFINGSTNVFFEIQFRKMSKKELKRFYQNNPKEYFELLGGTALEGIEMFGDFKGCTEYPILVNDSLDSGGDLLDSKIQTYGNCDGKGNPEKWKSFNIEKLTKDTLVISGYMGQPLENKIVYSKIK